jgi:hypothetical protein
MTGSITSCLAVIASLCIDGPATVVVGTSASWTGAVITYQGANVVSMTSSDDLMAPRTEDMHRLCTNGVCLFYRGHCGPSGAQFACLLWYSHDATMPLRNVLVTGDRASVSRASARLSLVRSVDVLVPFPRLVFDAPDDSPPTCREREGCSAAR